MKHDLKEGLRDCQSNQSLKTKRQSASVLARSENGISSKQCFLILNRANENTHRTYASTRFFFFGFFFRPGSMELVLAGEWAKSLSLIYQTGCSTLGLQWNKRVTLTYVLFLTGCLLRKRGTMSIHHRTAHYHMKACYRGAVYEQDHPWRSVAVTLFPGRYVSELSSGSERVFHSWLEGTTDGLLLNVNLCPFVQSRLFRNH